MEFQENEALTDTNKGTTEGQRENHHSSVSKDHTGVLEYREVDKEAKRACFIAPHSCPKVPLDGLPSDIAAIQRQFKQPWEIMWRSSPQY